MERCYGFAGMKFRVIGHSEDMYCEDGVLASFLVDTDCVDHSLSLEVVDTLPVPEGEEIFARGQVRVLRQGIDELVYIGSVTESADGAYMQIRRSGKMSYVKVLRKEVPAGITPRLVLNALQTEHHILKRNGFLLHASFIRWKDRAILFTAPSGTGKSTQAELWQKLRNAEIINGDRVAVTQDASGITAWGIPYCGTSGICQNTQLPLAAIVYLSQAPATSICRLSGVRAFRHIWEGCSVNLWNENDVDRCVEAVMTVANQVPVYYLACTPDETAVEALERMLEKGEA